MSNITKLQSTSSTFIDKSSVISNETNLRSYQRILNRRQTQTTPETRQDQSFVLFNSNSMENDHIDDQITRSIIMDSATQQRGFLPYDYRAANTFNSIRRQRHYYQPLLKPVLPSTRTSLRTTTRFDVFGNLTNSMSKLADQRLTIRENSSRKQHYPSIIRDKREKSFLEMSDVDFAADIPNALEIVVQKSKTKSSVERYLFETLKRERSQKSRYRLLPINRSPNT